MDVEWKEQVLEKLKKIDELVVQVQRVVDTLERIVGMRLKTPEDDLISWPESGGEKTKIVERVNKGKGSEVVKIEYNSKQSKMVIKDRGDRIEEVEEVVGTLALSV